jgi:hypothetical protein
LEKDFKSYWLVLNNVAMTQKDLFSDMRACMPPFVRLTPHARYDCILKNVTGRDLCVGLCHGQWARALSKYFKVVEATDISAAQLENATYADNIRYHIGSAEKTDT